MKRIDQKGAVLSALVIAVMGISLMASLGFGLWAFTSRADFKNNTDKKIAAAVAENTQKVSAAKEAELAEKEKSPTKTYTSPAAQGSIGFNFPKTWSALVTELSQPGSAKPLDGYFHPNYLPGITNTTVAFALRVELVTQSYDQVINPFNNQAASGAVKVVAFKPDRVPSALGVKIEGTLANNKQGAMVVLPLRDKTLKIWTESQEFVSDFNAFILPTLTFVP